MHKFKILLIEFVTNNFYITPTWVRAIKLDFLMLLDMFIEN